MVLQHLPCSIFFERVTARLRVMQLLPRPLSRWRGTGVRAAQHLLCPLSR